MFSGNIEACCNLRIFVALKMGAVMSLLVEERTPLGDHEPIFVSRYPASSAGCEAPRRQADEALF
jgi:hypothetical protein